MRATFRITADGTDVTAAIRDRLIRLAVTDAVDASADIVEIEIDDRDHLVALPAPGAGLEIALGFAETGLVALGRYVTDEIAGDVAPATLTVRARAADMRGAIRARKTRSWHDVTLGDIVETIAAEHGLTPRVGEDLRDHAYPYLAQTSESDLHLLTRLAHTLDAVAKPAGGALIVARRGESALPVIVLHRTKMQGGSWKIAGRGRYGSVIAAWAERGTATLRTLRAGDGEPTLTLRHRHASGTEARGAAEAALARARRAGGSISIQLAGFHGDLTAGARVVLKGLKPELEGEWHLTRVRHTLARTLTTRFEAERDNGEKT